MPRASLVDIGFRIEQCEPDAEEVLVAGDRVRAADIGVSPGAADTTVLRSAAAYVLDTLVPFQLRFPDSDRMEVIGQYLQKRNAEQVLGDGFYIGCGDVCVVTAALLEQYGYHCRLLHAVSSNFTDGNDVGHVLLCVEKERRRYLYDPTMSGDITADYEPDSTGTLGIRSAIGDLFVFAVDRNPRRLGIHDMASLRQARAAAHKRWLAAQCSTAGQVTR